MTFSVGFFRSALPLLIGVLLGGCLPSGPKDEEKEQFFLAGKSRVITRDFKGAIESFERAAEVNPKSAPAHFELGWLYDQKESDPAAAIYHYERFLKLSPNSGKEETVRTRILACKQQLVQTVSLDPVTEKQTREFELLAEENKRLREELEKWRASANRLQNPTNAAEPRRSPVAPAASPRTHIIKAGETPGVIARQYGVKVEALMAANPGLDPKRLRPGRALAIPGS
jgi:LysM repeat protein